MHRKKHGNRWDAYRLGGLDPVHVMMPYMFGSRIENEAVLGEVLDLTALDKYLAEKNAAHPESKYTWFQFICAALAKAIDRTPFSEPVCPIYQNVDSLPHTDPAEIKANLIAQLTGPVLWSQSVLNMHQAGATDFIELGPGSVLTNLIGRIIG